MEHTLIKLKQTNKQTDIIDTIDTWNIHLLNQVFTGHNSTNTIVYTP